MTSINYSQATSRINVEIEFNVSETGFAFIIRVDIGPDGGSRASLLIMVSASILTWPFARENFIALFFSYPPFPRDEVFASVSLCVIKIV
jgi:hypothetical protein